MKENWEKGKNQEPKTPTHHQWELRKFYAWPSPPVLVSFAWPSLILKVIRFSKCVNVCFCIVSLPQERMSVKSVSEEKSQNVLRTPVSISRDFLLGFFHQVGSHRGTFRRDPSRERCFNYEYVYIFHNFWIIIIIIPTARPKNLHPPARKTRN